MTLSFKLYIPSIEAIVNIKLELHFFSFVPPDITLDIDYNKLL